LLRVVNYWVAPRRLSPLLTENRVHPVVRHTYHDPWTRTSGEREARGAPKKGRWNIQKIGGLGFSLVSWEAQASQGETYSSHPSRDFD
jgi:hypothetical protein